MDLWKDRLIILFLLSLTITLPADAILLTLSFGVANFSSR